MDGWAEEAGGGKGVNRRRGVGAKGRKNFFF